MSGFLEKYDNHYIFSIEAQFEGRPAITVFRKFTSEEFRAAMVDRLSSNIENEGDNQSKDSDEYKKIQEELQMMKIRSMYNKSSPLLCIHSNKELIADDIGTYIEGVESVQKFIEDTKLDL